MDTLIPVLTRLANDLRATNSVKAKQAILRNLQYHPRWDDINDALFMIYNPYIKFGVTSKRCRAGRVQEVVPAYGDLKSLLVDLAARRITGNRAVAEVCSYAHYNVKPEDQETYWNIIDKDLKCRIDAKLLNHVYPGMIPQFNVALAQSYDDYVKRVVFTKDRWLASRKLDGVRVICKVTGPDKQVTFWSRKGLPFTTLSKVADALRKLPRTDYVLDGEMCLRTPYGEDDFRGIVKQIKRKPHTIENPHYLVFDCLTPDEFDQAAGCVKLSARLGRMEFIARAMPDYITIVDQHVVTDAAHFERLRDQARTAEWEGLILRKDVGYEGKRSPNMLKVKDFQDAEFEVVGYESSVIGYADTVSGRAIQEVMLGKVFIPYKGNQVGVGSGFTIEERQHYYQHPEDIVGHTITVQYFGESQDERGRPSLRFPTFKAVYEGERDV